MRGDVDVAIDNAEAVDVSEVPTLPLRARRAGRRLGVVAPASSEDSGEQRDEDEAAHRPSGYNA